MFKLNSFKGLLLNLLVILALAAGLILGFFFVYLPVTTHHGESITVPSLAGMSIDELDKFLSERNLRYQINDSSYAVGVKPNTVLTQHPLEGSKVKQNRKIYLTISSVHPPKVKMPKLTDGSLKSAEMALKGFDLVLGNIKYVPSPYSNLVLEQMADNKPVEPGTFIPKGTKIDLIVGNGTGTEEVDVPDLSGMPADEAKILLRGLGLTVSERNDPDAEQDAGTVTKQRPLPGKKLRTGEIVDVWISGPDNP